jgi:hypothetical protein
MIGSAIGLTLQERMANPEFSSLYLMSQNGIRQLRVLLNVLKRFKKIEKQSMEKHKRWISDYSFYRFFWRPIGLSTSSSEYRTWGVLTDSNALKWKIGKPRKEWWSKELLNLEVEW